METFSSRIEEPYFGFTRPLYLYLVFMFTTSSKNCGNNKLIEQPHRYYCYKKVHFQPEKVIIIRIKSTKLNDAVRSHYLPFAKQSQ